MDASDYPDGPDHVKKLIVLIILCASPHRPSIENEILIVSVGTAKATALKALANNGTVVHALYRKG